MFVHCSRGLDCIELGVYKIEIQNISGKGRQILDLVSVEDNRKIVSLEIEMEEMEMTENLQFS